jgi:hypothetical protein
VITLELKALMIVNEDVSIALLVGTFNGASK